ncbi:DEAD/DEAH box helicase [Metabacillus herbersteinensis]|uniref:DEAD-box ATP-dependent RNA helicase CshA n=1 Tax=Metabacillus herbersteinensis TaxID=283816 RepID=A0ABV6GL93_9BACI
MTIKFEDFGLSSELMQSINKLGFEEPSPIQAETIPLGLQNKDVIGQAQTGTGKTAAFGIPLIEKIQLNNDTIQAIVVAPTRELAIQVSEELYKIGYHKRARVLPIYGGQDINRQMRSLKKNPHIIVGTPGRLIDHINRKTIRLSSVHTVVLDEADEMLNMGFIEDIESILSNVPKERQTLLFSATMPDPIRRIAEKFMHDPSLVKVKAKEMTVPNIQQFYVDVHERKKFDVLTRLLDIHSPELAIIFGRTKRRVDELSEALTLRGYAAEGIHGDLTQAKRMSTLRKFKEGNVEILVATDVAARGLDISGVTHVYNFDVPQDPESYVHRIGRTGRAGKHGMALTFVTPREIDIIKNIERTTNRKMDRMNPPTLDEAIESQQQMTIEKLRSTIEAGNLEVFKRTSEELLEEFDAQTVVAAAIKLTTKDTSAVEVKLTDEAPMRSKNRSSSSSNSRRRDSGRGGSSTMKNNRSHSSQRDRDSKGKSSTKRRYSNNSK